MRTKSLCMTAQSPRRKTNRTRDRPFWPDQCRRYDSYDHPLLNLTFGTTVETGSS